MSFGERGIGKVSRHGAQPDVSFQFTAIITFVVQVVLNARCNRDCRGFHHTGWFSAPIARDSA